MSFKPIDPKRDEIRRYLERGSVLDSLTKIFIRVIKERPENPMEYIRNNIGIVRHQHDKYERLAQDLQEANEEIQRLRAIINSINPEVLQGPHVGIESEESEPTTVAEKVEKEPVTEEAEIIPNSNATATATNANELAAAVENCHIEEQHQNNVVVDEVTKSVEDSSPTTQSIQSTTVQAEPSSE